MKTCITSHVVTLVDVLLCVKESICSGKPVYWTHSGGFTRCRTFRELLISENEKTLREDFTCHF